jgi:wyosine [tRNA(Phe)-imidazoG37] synthetase (radical SAM superfamily)
MIPSGSIVYPVYSRRSGGLSLGIDPFPGAKVCGFDCPYCEVFAPRALPQAAAPGPAFSLASLRSELDLFLEGLVARDARELPRDLCVSGSGEPTDSPELEGILDLCAEARRRRPELLGSASLVLITNSTGFLDPGRSALLERFVRDEGLVLWAKLDAGSEELFRLMSGTTLDLDEVAEGILGFARRVPIVLQTMLCELRGRCPTEADLDDYSTLVSRLAAGGAQIRELQLYTFARPTPGGGCAALPDALLSAQASSVARGTGLRVRAFGERGELAPAKAPRAAGSRW